MKNKKINSNEDKDNDSSELIECQFGGEKLLWTFGFDCVVCKIFNVFIFPQLNYLRILPKYF